MAWISERIQKRRMDSFSEKQILYYYRQRKKKKRNMDDEEEEYEKEARHFVYLLLH